MNFVDLAGEELKKLLSNRFTRIAVLVVCGIPLLYSFLYLYAFWDPYGKLDKLPVAVVNEDKGAVSGGKQYNFGRDLEDSLRDNNAARWEFVSSEDARYGLDHKKYYLAVRVPEDFSQKVLSVDGDQPERANLEFIANQGSNYLASQIGNRLIGEIKDSLAQRISKNYVENIMASIRTTSDGLAQAGSGAGRLANGIGDAESGSKKLTNALDQASGATEQVADGAGQMSKGAADLYNGLRQTGQASALMDEKTGQAQQGLRQIGDGLNAAKQGSAVLTDKLTQAADGEKTVNQGLQSAGAGARKLAEGNNQVSQGLKSVSDGLGTVTQGLNTVASSTANGTTKLKLANGQLVSGTQTLATSLKQYSAGLDTIADGAGASQAALAGSQASLQAYLQKHPEANGDPDFMKALATLQGVNSDKGLGAVQSGLKASKSALNSRIIPAVETINRGQQDLGSGIDQIGSRLTSALTGDGSGNTAVIPALKEMKTSIESRLIPGSDELKGQTEKLADGIDSLAQGTGQLYSGLKTASEKVGELNTGTAKMANGNDTLVKGLATLQENLRLMSGAQSKMAEGANKLQQGAQKSGGALNSIHGGLTSIKAGQVKLGNGLVQLKQGAGQLSQELTAASAKVKKETTQPLANDKSDVIANPVNLKDDSIHKVDQYGSGFAPYFIPLSLWVGALMIFFVISPKSKNPGGSFAQRALGKYLTVASVSVSQALVTSFVIRNVLHLAVTKPLQFYLFNVLMSLAFVAIIQFLSGTFGIAGRLIGLVLLMLQLTSAGGTFPIELVPRFFQVLNPFLPMSYGVAGLREIISGANSSLLATNVLVLAGFGIVFLGLTVFSYYRPLFAKLNLPDEVSV